MNLRYLAGSVDLPYVTPQGRLVTRHGWDEGTCLYLNTPVDWTPRVPDRPTADDVRAAIRVMMAPWSGYRFADADSAAGMVSAVLAAVTRLVLDLSPAYMFDAAVQGSGKTKAATALGALMEGQRPAVTPFAGSSTEDETRKRLVAGAVGGVRFSCTDNISGFFKSSVLAAVLTSGRLSDRLLGQSQIVNAQVRSLLTMTSNNASMEADLLRRTVQIRIDAGANPTHRAFAFCPVTAALTQRRRIAEAACTVLRAYFNADASDVVAGDAGGFTDWNRLCRQPVLWLAREGLAEGVLPWPDLGDPAASMLRDPADGDPEIEATGDMVAALWALSEGRVFTSIEALAWLRAGQGDDGVFGRLRDAIAECVGKTELTAASLGRVLAFRRDRVIGGLKLLARGSGRTKGWRVVRVQ